MIETSAYLPLLVAFFVVAAIAVAAAVLAVVLAVRQVGSPRARAVLDVVQPELAHAA